MQRPLAVTICLSILATTLPAWAPSAQADTASVMGATFGSARDSSAAVWAGTSAYIFGGFDGTDGLWDIVRYDPATDTATYRSALPWRTQGASAVWDGTRAYIFGGVNSGSWWHMDTIVRYDPAANQVTTLGTKLPAGLAHASAVWDGAYAYIFGGLGQTSLQSSILRYHAATGTITTMGAMLPTGRSSTSAVWDGTNAYIFGGSDGRDLSQILRYNPASDTITTMGAELPYKVDGTSAVWDGTSAYIFGGYNDESGSFRADVVRYEPSSDTVTTMSATLPSGRRLTSAVGDGTNAYVFGGVQGWYQNAVRYNQIVRYSTLPPPTAPQQVSATPGTGEITVSWQPPANEGGRPVTNYRIYGGSTSGAEGFLAEVGNVLSYRETGLGNGVTRFYRVSAESAAGEGPKSPPVSATTFTTPGAPQNLAATAGPGAGQIGLSWQAPASTGGGPVTGYRIFRGTESGGKVFLADVGTAMSHIDTGLPNGATRYYQVAALTSAGAGPRSNDAVATTFDAPSAPVNLAATAGPGVGQITLNWQAPWTTGGTPVTGYRLLRGTTSGGESFLADVGNVLSYVDAGLLSGTRFYYRVAAINLVGTGPASGGASATTFSPPDSPTALTAAAGPGAGQITLDWQAATTNGGMPVVAYRIYRGTSSGATSFLSEVGDVRTYVDSALGNGATRYYRITAVNAVGEGAPSNEASGVTFAPPSTPQNPSASPGPGLGRITLTWQPPADSGRTPVTGYRIHRAVTSGPYAAIDTVGPVLSYTDTSCPTPAVCYYRVSALNLAGEGPRSNETFAPGTPADTDADLVPDFVEPPLCGPTQNRNLHADGDCTGSNWTAPTLAGLLQDVESLT